VSPSLVPLLVLALLLMGVEHKDAARAELVMSGTHELTDHESALIVGDASVTIPVGVEILGPVYVIGGDVRIQGSVRTSVMQLAGELIVEETATIDGELRSVAGSRAVSENATIGRRTMIELTPTSPNPLLVLLPFAFMSGILALAGAAWARRRPGMLINVGRALTQHPVISLTVGTLVALTGLSLIVFMAFTLVLIPISILGLLTAALAVGCGVVTMGHLVGQHTRIRKAGLATGIGALLVMAGLELIGLIPLIGDLVAMGILTAALGAVVITYFGLSEFNPVKLPE